MESQNIMQEVLALTPGGSTRVNGYITVKKTEDQMHYYFYLWPLFQHHEKDKNSFRLITAMLLNAGLCKQSELVKAFGMCRRRLNRAVHQLVKRGVGSFFEKRKGRQGGHILKEERLAKAQEMLDEIMPRSEICRRLEVDYSTLSKAIRSGRLVEPRRQTDPASTQSERTQADARAAEGLGTACTHTAERMAASIGLIKGAETRFNACVDVPNGGSLCALPALLENGLLHNMDTLGRVEGYYTVTQILLVLSLMLVARIKNVEQLGDGAPGEFGKLIGLDRVPEARCLRGKMATLSENSCAEQWSAEIADYWLQKHAETTGFLYVDGHVKVYGGANPLPRRYVSRQRLCLRGISFYWVNDAWGCPFFVVERQIDPGMLEVLRKDIVPCLLNDVPRQPSPAALAADPLLHRFVLVFDREGSSPAFFKEMWATHRIACLSYRKKPVSDWPEADFSEGEAETVHGEKVKMRLAERRTTFGQEQVPVKEIRKLSSSGHQTAMITTAQSLDSPSIAVHMFTRWCQENFFAYAMHHYGIDQLRQYGTEDFPVTEMVVNPSWRELDTRRRRTRTLLQRRVIYLHSMNEHKAADPLHKGHPQWIIRQNETIEDIQQFKGALEDINPRLKEIPKHIALSELPENTRFKKMTLSSRTLMNTMGMICYRAETAMASLFMDKSLSLSDARAVLQALFNTTADIRPDVDHKTLNVHLHSSSTPRDNRLLERLFKHLNDTETIFPGSDMKMVFHSLAHPHAKNQMPDSLIDDTPANKNATDNS